MEALNRFGPLVGRILLALIFLLSGFGKITGFEGTVGYIASKGLPLPQLAAIGAIIVELGSGIMLVVASFIFHNFWAAPADQAQDQMIHFLKNISMMGGLLYVAVYGSGPMSVGVEK